MLQNKQAEEEEKEEGTELDQIDGKGATRWGSKKGSLAAGEGVDTESSSTAADRGSTSSTLPSSPSHRWALSTEAECAEASLRRSWRLSAGVSPSHRSHGIALPAPENTPLILSESGGILKVSIAI
jgi:hypothetical protein